MVQTPQNPLLPLLADRTRRRSALLLIFCCVLSVLWGSFIAHSSSGGLTDFKAVYYASRCLIEHADPYKDADFLRVFLADGGKIPSEPVMGELFRRSVFTCVNLPSALFLLIPLAWLPVVPAYFLWALLTAAGLGLSAILMASLAAEHATHTSLLLAGFVVANTVILFADGNAAGMVISLCVIAVWCFVQNRFVPAGILCLAISLALKPHDAGLVWLYFLLAGGIYRKRALQTLFVTAALCLPAVLWVAHAVPDWMTELRSNIQLASAHGGLNDPGPTSIGFHHPDPIINLQAVLSIFHDDPRTYVPASLLICAALLLLWSAATLRERFTPQRTWLALAAIAALSMLVTYHRQHDAKLLLLTIPGCAILWSRRGIVGWLALLANSAAIFFTADIPSTALGILTSHLTMNSSFGAQLKTALLVRPAPICLLILAVFYVGIYFRTAEQPSASPAATEEFDKSPAWAEMS